MDPYYAFMPEPLEGTNEYKDLGFVFIRRITHATGSRDRYMITQLYDWFFENKIPVKRLLNPSSIGLPSHPDFDLIAFDSEDGFIAFKLRWL